jgi:hypothetical protein
MLTLQSQPKTEVLIRVDPSRRWFLLTLFRFTRTRQLKWLDFINTQKLTSILTGNYAQNNKDNRFTWGYAANGDVPQRTEKCINLIRDFCKTNRIPIREEEIPTSSDSH